MRESGHRNKSSCWGRLTMRNTPSVDCMLPVSARLMHRQAHPESLKKLEDIA